MALLLLRGYPDWFAVYPQANLNISVSDKILRAILREIVHDDAIIQLIEIAERRAPAADMHCTCWLILRFCMR